MLASNCYKLVRTLKMFSEAEVACQAEGAMLAKPITLLQVGYFTLKPGLNIIKLMNICNTLEVLTVMSMFVGILNFLKLFKTFLS
jgi:hypothetical protein